VADLNEETKTVVRKRWDRANKIRVENEFGKPPKVTFEIQTATTDDGELVGTVPKSILVIAYDPAASYPLINPMDDSILTESGGSHAGLQVQLYSLFKHITKG